MHVHNKMAANGSEASFQAQKHLRYLMHSKGLDMSKQTTSGT
jgi:hypothetical protein